MPFRIVATLLAEGVSLDRFTDRLTAFNMMEAVFTPSVPAVIGKLVVVNIYEVDGDREPRWERVTVLDADGQLLAEARTELLGEGAVHRSMAMFQGIGLAKAGDFKILVEGARRGDGPWRELAQRRLHVVLRPHPLARPDEGTPEAGKIRGPAALTD
jgi:hypothetical protein